MNLSRVLHALLLPAALLWAAVTFLLPGLACSEVRPDQVAVIVNKAVPAGMKAAEHYIYARKVPRAHVFVLDLPEADSISRSEYEEKLVLPLRRRLTALKLQTQVRVLVTMYGVPLRLDAPEPDAKDKEMVLRARVKQEEARKKAVDLIEAAQRLGGGRPEERPGEPGAEADDRALVERLLKALKEAGERVNKLPDNNARKALTRRLARLLFESRGVTGIAESIRAGETKEQAAGDMELRRLSEQILMGQALLRRIDQIAPYENQIRAYGLAQRLFGVPGILMRAGAEIKAREYQEGEASVDSELSMLWWDRQLYPVSGWVPNPLYLGPGAAANPDELAPIVMVSRLDAPTPELVIGMIDNALLGERKGLEGKVYIDTRGMQPERKTDALALWDQKLLDFGWQMRSLTDYPVVIDKYDAVFTEALRAAVYVGWYSLRRFQGKFSFSPGAIGYHVASEEAVDIHSPGETGWCRGLLQSGITVTLGPTAEPYLDAFPRPRDFFGFLMSGQYAVVEAYYLSIPQLSWRMVLLGDPLYNPWRGRSSINVADWGIERQGKKIEAPPRPPAEMPMTDGAALLEQIKRNRAALQVQIDEFFKALQARQAEP